MFFNSISGKRACNNNNLLDSLLEPVIVIFDLRFVSFDL
ncbi:hypothetical protein JCM19538_2572 [Jejuia pallidilutea]|uniref:Uncharacterized protein n=1 Tax=Jejuia pallidilutea TaxID=504487 RepID=A0A098LNV8_9FLAO|nr:hypothetical protein JCM19538_2572 [Jejuia pallidilutea]